MSQPVYGLEPDEIGLFARDVLPGRDRNVAQPAAQAIVSAFGVQSVPPMQFTFQPGYTRSTLNGS